MATREEVRRLAVRLEKEFVDRGCLIEAGYAVLRGTAMHPDAPQQQIDEMRFAFMAGAQHLFASIMGILDPGEEPTDRDMRRLNSIHEELDRFRKEMELRMNKAEGRA